MKWRILKAFSSLIVFLFGFSTTLMAQYGVVETEFVFKGEVLSVKTGERIPGIKLTVNDENGNFRQDNGLEQSDDGTFKIYSYSYGGMSSFEIKAEDIDGDKNGGTYKPAGVIFSTRDNDFMRDTSRHGSWHRYYNYSKNLVILMEEETPLTPVEPENPEPADTVKISGALPEITLIADTIEESGSTIKPTALTIQDALIFPNPTKGNITIEINPAQTQDIRISLYDSRNSLLREVLIPATEGTIRQQLDLSGYACGVYYIRIEGRSFRASGKVIKN